MPDDIQALIQAGRYPDALRLTERVCAANPGQPEPWLLKASIHAQMGDFAGITAACEHVIRLQPNHAAAHYNLALALQSSGQAKKAISHYRVVLTHNPEHIPSLTNLGAIYRDSAQLEDALVLLEKAVQHQPGFATARNALGLTYCDLGRYDAALEQFRSALQLQPGLLDAATNIARIYWLRGEVTDALAQLEYLLTQHPTLTDALLVKVRILDDTGNPAAAIGELQAAIAQTPRDARLHYELAHRLVRASQQVEAVQHYQTAIEINPNDYQSLNNLGALLHSLDRTREGLAHLQKATAINPESAQTHINLSILYAADGNDLKAQEHCLRALQLQPGRRDTLQRFVQIISNGKTFIPNSDFQRAVLACFDDPGIDQQNLVGPALTLILSAPQIARLCIRCHHGDLPQYKEFSVLWSGTRAAIFERILTHTIIAKAELEHCIRAYRRAALLYFTSPDGQLLHPPTQEDLEQLLALAHQCFNTEFAFEIAADEESRLSNLTAAMDLQHTEDKNQPWPTCVLLALYRPLTDSVTQIDSSTLSQAAAGLFTGLLKKQVFNLRREQQIKDELPQITRITEGTSASVRDQYEESPYPRWLSVDIQAPRPYPAVFRESFPDFSAPDFGTAGIETLIAGCGTGKHAILSATRFDKCSVTAIDLSRSSLAYGKRSAEELGIGNIEFHCGDILGLGDIGKTFHIIESVGVLHHMADPEQGLSVLRALLAPHGLMNLGLYSSLARRAVYAARDYFQTEAGLPDLEGIRRARSEILSLPDDHPIHPVTEILDFYSLSDCRDLLFHTQERCYTLADIAALLDRNRLKFVGFELPDTRIKTHYREQFPDDPSMTDLAKWNQFELDHPDTFIGMYTFWCQALD